MRGLKLVSCFSVRDRNEIMVVPCYPNACAEAVTASAGPAIGEQSALVHLRGKEIHHHAAASQLCAAFRKR